MPTPANTLPEGFDPHPYATTAVLRTELNAGTQEDTWTDPMLNYLLANRERNGLDTFVVMIGGKRLVSIPGFKHWIATRPSRNENAGRAA